jgi:hypothetical protein
VGFAGKRSRLKDTVNASCDSAVAALIESASSRITAAESSAAGSNSLSAVHIRSEGRLVNFHVLEFWIDPDSGAAWTLAAARIAK